MTAIPWQKLLAILGACPEDHFLMPILSSPTEWIACANRSPFVSLVVLSGALFPLLCFDAPTRANEASKPAENVLPLSTSRRIGAGPFRLSNYIAGLGFIDNHSLLSGDSDAVRIWDCVTAKEQRRLEWTGWSAGAVAVSDDGRLVACAGSYWNQRDKSWHGGLRVWNAAAGSILWTRQDEKLRIRHIAFSPGGNQLACGHDSDGTISVWDARSGNQIWQVPGAPHTWVVSITYSPDGSLLAVAKVGGPNPPTVVLCDAKAGRPLRSLPPLQTGDFSGFNFSPDGKTIAAVMRLPGGPGERERDAVVFWDAATGKEVRRLPTTATGDTGKPMAMAFSRDGRRLATSGRDGSLSVWELSGGRPRLLARERVNGFAELAFSPDGKRLAAGACNWIRVWDVESGRELTPKADAHQARITGLLFAEAEGCLVSASHDFTIRLWDLHTGRQRRVLRGHQHSVLAIALSPEAATLASCSFDDTLRLWNLQTGTEEARLPGHGNMGFQRALAFSPDGGRLVSWGDDNKLQVFRHGTNGWAPSGPALTTEPGLGLLTPDGHFLVTIFPKIIRCIETSAGRTVAATGGAYATSARAVSPDHRTLLLANWRDPGRLRDIRSGSERVPTGCPAHISSAAFSPDGRLVAVGTQFGGIQLFEVATGSRVLTLSCPCPVDVIAFSQGDQTLAAGLSDSSLFVWDLSPERMVRYLSLKRPQSAELSALWAELGSADGERAYRAVWRLATAPELSVDFLKNRLPARPSVDKQWIEKLIRELDHARFSVRDAAQRRLHALGEEVFPAIRAALHGHVSDEVRGRLEALLIVPPVPPSAALVQRLRGIHVLELVHSAEARSILKTLAGGAAGAWDTREAAEALHRIAN